MESGYLFGEVMTTLVPALQPLSRAIEKRQRVFGFMAYVVALKPHARI
ncbi:MAG: hypothetical protein IAI49_12970 [Candidatus Eremiobacteraeota bacterium]|nr:hypothetical protein [Candidatus Eremiobacteraeota bacterium]